LKFVNKYIKVILGKNHEESLWFGKNKNRPKAPGKQLALFAEEEIYRNYRYSAYVSNLNLPAAEIWRLYRGRGDAENRIKELKYVLVLIVLILMTFFPLKLL